ncbi:hypothetical protein Asppvi_009215 [Aspergillus pseudoviridinutans]|uniref:Uncharacterized protein n=1 Tax=Aspergillus pseudoviridinutans TaxID=1517512 RepID=A0A9P3BM55_9EURO|nr:uncharacterized protein Asppvi_009215 [Aspergillus pseudoviridinutans]GIJ90261.1 hypothetical protein Asppvi_009215 [Aspergillus pseudoviridinutans]
MTKVSSQEVVKRAMERRSRSPESRTQLDRSEWDSESGTGTEHWTPDHSDSSNGDNKNELAVDLLAEENTESIENCTQESQINAHTSQATSTPSTSDPKTTDKRWRALMYLNVEQFLKLDIIHKIIENLDDRDLVDVMEQALNVEDLDFTMQRRVQYEVLCTSQKQRIYYLNHYLRDEGAETREIKTHTKLTLHNELYQFCVKNPEKKRGMLLDQLRQISTLKVFNALARQIWGLSAEERDKLGDDAIRYHERRREVDPKYWLPWEWL